MRPRASSIPPRRSASPSRRPSAATASPHAIKSQPPLFHRTSLRRLLAFCGGGVALLLLLVLAFSLLWPQLFPHATVILTPQVQTLSRSFSLPATRVGLRSISATAPTQSATTNATGSLPATKASGKLTFLNESTVDITIQSGTLTAPNGVQVSFTGPLQVSATGSAQVTTTGTAVKAGASGNLPAFAISMFCCAPNNEIEVQNTTAFTGGADASPLVQQHDIDQASASLISFQTAQEKKQLISQMHTGEQIVPGSLQCAPSVQSNVPAGTQANRVTVTVAVTCTASVLSQTAVQQNAASKLGASMPAGFALVGQVTVEVIGQLDSGTVQVQAQGTWVYHFSASQLTHLATLIAGQSQASARQILSQQPGISQLRISGPDPLPSAGQIQFQIQPIS